MIGWTALLSIVWAVARVAAAPTIAFPFNSQVPTVARKNEQYNYRLSSSTFTYTGSVTYSLAQQPAWLSIDSKTLTLTGRPGDADVGTATFIIIATDNTGATQMPCTLVVAADPAPKLKGDFSQQLAAEINLTSTSPTSFTLTPGTRYDFSFQRDSFIDIVQRKLYYYSTLTDHTPLPSWLIFNADKLTFSGITPALSAFPQSFAVSLIASDYQGFSGTSADFTIIIATQQLAVVPFLQTVRISPGGSLKYDLAGSVYVDGRQLAISNVASASASLPSWANFDAKSLVITGNVPQSEKADTGNFSVTDRQGNTAQGSLRFVTSNDTLFTGDIGTITAEIGQPLQYTIPSSVLSSQNVTLSLLVPAEATWVRLDPQARVIYGLVPSNATASTLDASLKAQSPSGLVESLPFRITLQSTSDGSGSASVGGSGSSGGNSTRASLPAGSIAAIVVCSILGAAILLALLFICCRRRRRTQGYVDRDTPSPTKRRLISGPTLLVKPNDITVTTQVHTDVEKAGELERESVEDDPPPQIAVEIPAPLVRSARLGMRASATSQVSSIGHGEDAIKRDANIPEWGQDPSVLQKPHESSVVPTIIARGPKRLSAQSASKRAQRLSKQSIGLGIDTNGGSVKHSKKTSRIKNKTSSTGLSITHERSSIASLSTQATSLLSTKPSDFPRPPTQSTFSYGSRSIPTMSYVDPDNRRSIRLLGRSDSSTLDPRPMSVKRASYIRARASTSLQSPLFSHGSRGPLESRSGRGSSSDMDMSMSVLDRWRARRKALKSAISQSSMALSERDSRRLSQRVRSAFAPNFPRVVSDSDYEEDWQDPVDDDFDEAWEDITPSQSQVQSANNLASEMAKPRHLRSWVLPGEASPTPPPPSAARRAGYEAKARWRRHMEKAEREATSPLAAAANNEQEDAPAIPKRSPKRRQSYINEPIGLVSKDSLSGLRDNGERPRLGNISTSRPVSVDNVDRLSSLKAETMDALAGSEMDEERSMQGTALKGPHPLFSHADTPKSQASGTAFL